MRSPFLDYTAYLSIFSISHGVQAQQSATRLRRRNSDVLCPCIVEDIDDKLINADPDNLEIDLHRERSCSPNSPSNVRTIFWTPLDPDERPKSNLVRPIDGVKYNYLKTVIDTESSTYTCTRNDSRFTSLTLQEAQACMAVMDNICNDIKPQLCEFDVSFMEEVKESASSGELMLDQEKSCKEPTNEEEKLGIYAKTPEIRTKAAITFDNDYYFKDSEVAMKVGSEMEGKHCKNLISMTCSGWDLNSYEDDSLQCADDPNFVLHGSYVEELMEDAEDKIFGSTSAVKNCEWVASNGKCGTKSRSTNKRAFESCRKSCGYCTCTDSDKYRFNGQRDKGCDWIKGDAATRCHLEGASDNCKASCKTDCCQDNPDFRYEHNEKKSCQWARKNQKRKSFRCSLRLIAINCPQSCGFCPASS